MIYGIVFYNLGRVYKVNGDYELAVDNYKKARESNLDNLLSYELCDYREGKGKFNKIKEIFDCRNPKHLISEFYYLIANLHASEENYALSNFYLNLSFYLNPDFIFNNALLAENYFHLKDYQSS